MNDHLEASFNQKSLLSDIALQSGNTLLFSEVQARRLWIQPMTVRRYKLIRNAILSGKHDRAKMLIKKYPVFDNENVSIQ